MCGFAELNFKPPSSLLLGTGAIRKKKKNLHHRVLYLKEDVGCIVHTHDQSASSKHVVGVGECDEQYGGQVVDKHDEEILSSVK